MSVASYPRLRRHLCHALPADRAVLFHLDKAGPQESPVRRNLIKVKISFVQSILPDFVSARAFPGSLRIFVSPGGLPRPSSGRLIVPACSIVDNLPRPLSKKLQDGLSLFQ